MGDEMIESLEQGYLLRVYVDENDKVDGHPAFHWVVQLAMEKGMKGATALRGMEGYGSRHKLHTSGVLSLSTNLPVVIEIIDDRKKIEEFIPCITEKLKDGLLSVERVRYQHLR